MIIGEGYSASWNASVLLLCLAMCKYINVTVSYSVPYEGVHINYVNSLQSISNGDFTVKYVHGSKGSMKVGFESLCI